MAELAAQVVLAGGPNLEEIGVQLVSVILANNHHPQEKSILAAAVDLILKRDYADDNNAYDYQTEIIEKLADGTC